MFLSSDHMNENIEMLGLPLNGRAEKVPGNLIAQIISTHAIDSGRDAIDCRVEIIDSHNVYLHTRMKYPEAILPSYFTNIICAFYFKEIRISTEF